MVGDEASELRSMLQINYPMQNGLHLFIFLNNIYNNTCIIF